MGQAVTPGSFKRRYRRSPYNSGIFFNWLTVLTCIHFNWPVISYHEVVSDPRFLQFWLIFPNRNYDSGSIEYNFNWRWHRTLHLKKKIFPISENLLKTSGTAMKVLSFWKIPLPSMHVDRFASCRNIFPTFQTSSGLLVPLNKLFYSQCWRVSLQFLFSIMRRWKINQQELRF